MASLLDREMKGLFPDRLNANHLIEIASNNIFIMFLQFMKLVLRLRHNTIVNYYSYHTELFIIICRYDVDAIHQNKPDKNIIPVYLSPDFHLLISEA